MSRNWIGQIDDLKKSLGLKTDAEIGAVLGLSRTMMSMVRNGRAELPAVARFTLLTKLGHTATRADVINAMVQALPEEFAARLLQADKERGCRKSAELPELRIVVKKLLKKKVPVRAIEAVVDEELS